ncbi:hypothetical protein IAT40_002229 [Kwoniella sp. CBS 6097]
MTACFERKRCEIAIFAKQVLDESLRARRSPYAQVVELWRSVGSFETGIPIQLRCRAALRAMVSVYHNTQDAEDASLAPSKRDVCLTFQQHTLSLHLGETVFSLLRPYFIDAIYNNAADPTLSPYGEAYLAVIERSSMLIVTVQSLYSLFPLIATRHWYFWLHAYSSAVCMATVCIVTPQSPLVGLCMSFLETAINLFAAAEDSLPQRVAKRNLDFLRWLRERAVTKTRSGHADPGGPQADLSESSPSATAEHLEVIGWRTRLIQLGAAGSHVAQVPLVPSRPRSQPDEGDRHVAKVADYVGGSVPNLVPEDGSSHAFIPFPGIDSPDILHQLLNENIGHSLPSLTDDNFDLGHLFGLSAGERGSEQ